MDQNELLAYLTVALDRHGVAYGITGSHASNVYGDTRFTNDIDVVVRLSTQEQLDDLLAEFPSGRFYVSVDGARHAVSNGGQFNIIHEDSSQKIDLIIPVPSEWPDPLLHRKRVATGAAQEMWFISLEDLVRVRSANRGFALMI